ncbi:MAG: hypothetical protein AAF458_00795 [Pseudomonadota bacterium]
MTEQKLAQVHNPDAEVFDARERATLRFATAMTANDGGDTAPYFDAMREFFDEPAIVEIGFAVATLHGMNIFNNMFGIEPEPEQMVSMTGVKAGEAAE